ncbi:MAG: LEPR-XLL domain-containing protein, partial [Burkholderiaceae bacterium]|nr:LEPR-XLL domain-containing protein [Burkholderiaceae bacterium]
MKVLRSVRNAFAVSSIANLISEAFRPKLPTTAKLQYRPPRRQSFSVEPLEPRLLLSADISYLPTVDPVATDFTLRVVDDGGLKIRLTDSASNLVGESTIVPADSVINISRFGGTPVQSAFADTVTIDLGTFDLLAPTADELTINFTGGMQDLFSDSVVLSGTGVLDYALTISSDADISVPASVSLTADDITLRVTMTDTGLPPIGTDGNEFYADADADIDVNGTLVADQITFAATSVLNVDNDSLGLGDFQFAFIYANSAADISIGTGADITAGALSATARSSVYASASMAALAGKTDTNTDAAIASVVIISNANARVSGNADIDVTGAFILDADNATVGAALADGSAGGAGATLGVAVITGGAEASISGSATVDAASVSVLAGSQNTLTALARSTLGGATESGQTGDDRNESEKALEENDAATPSGGLLGFAGAVSVGTLVDNTLAFVDTSGHVIATGLLDVSSVSIASTQTVADGSNTVIGSGNSNAVGIAAAIGVDVVDNHAFVAGSGVQAGAMNVTALMGDRTLDCQKSGVDAGNGTIVLLDGAHGLQTGDKIYYHKGASGNTALAGLTDGAPYYVGVQADGKVKLYNNSADALAGTNARALTGAGTGSGHTFTDESKTSRFGVTAIAGASGGSVGVAGALAIGVVITEAGAGIDDGTSVAINGGNVLIRAENYVASNVKASAQQTGTGKVGVGPSFALNVAITDTDAVLGNGADLVGGSGANDVTIESMSKNIAKTVVEGGAKGDLAVTPLIGITVANNDTNAVLGTLGSVTQLDGDLTVTARHGGAADTQVRGDTSSGDTGVGISLGLTIATDLVSATTARSVNADGAAAFNARSTANNRTKARASVAGGAESDKPAEGSQEETDGGVNTKVNESALFADDRAKAVASDNGKDATNKTPAPGDKASAEATGEDGNSQKIQVAGAAAVTVSSSTSRASIQDGTSIGAGLGGTGVVTVHSENNSDSAAIADASTVGATIKFDPTAAGIVDYSANTIDLGDKVSLTTGDRVVYKNGGGASISGLTNDAPYFVRVEDGKVSLYDTKAHAEAGGATGLQDLIDGAPAATGAEHSFDYGSEVTGIGIAVAVNVASVTNEALVGDSTTITADGLVVEALMAEVLTDKTHTFSAEAISGASAADTGVAGGLAVNVGLSHATAAVGTSAALNVGGNVTITAENFAVNKATASGKAEGTTGVGVGASIAVNVGETDTAAGLDNGVTLSGVNNLAISATSKNAMETVGTGGAKGATAVTPVIVVAVSNNETGAVIGTGGTASVAGDVILSAQHEGSNLAEAIGDTKSGDTGVGISLALVIATDSVLATTGRDLSAGGNVAFNAKTVSSNKSRAKASVAGGGDEDKNTSDNNGKTVDDKIADQHSAVDDRSQDAGGKQVTDTSDASAETSQGSGGNGTKVSVAGAVAVTVSNSTTDSSIPAGRIITAGAGAGTGAVALYSANATDSGAVADGSATVTGDGTSVGAAVAVNVANVTNLANVEAGAQVHGDGFSAEAVMAEREIKIKPLLEQVVNVDDDTIFIGFGSELYTGDAVTYKKGAFGNTNTVIAGLEDDKEYFVVVVGEGRIKLSDSADHARAGTDIIDLKPGATGTGHRLEPGFLKFADDIVFDPAGNVVLLEAGADNGFQTGEAVVYVSAAGSSDNIGDLVDGSTYYVILLSEGRMLLAATRDDALAGKPITLADAGTGTDHRLIDSTHSFNALAKSGASGGKIGVAGSVAISIANLDTEARAVAGSTVNITGTGDVWIAATSDTASKVLAEPTGPAGGTTLGVGASFGLNIVGNTALAEVEDGVAFTTSATSGNTTLVANSDNTMSTAALAGANSAEGTAVSGAVAIAISDHDVAARLGAGTDLTTSGALSVTASHTNLLDTKADGAAGGKGVGVGVAIGVVVAIDTTEASVDGTIVAPSGATVEASSTVKSVNEAQASAKGAEQKEDDSSKTADEESAQNTDYGKSKTATGSRAKTVSAPNANDKTSDANTAATNAEGQSAEADTGAKGQGASVKVGAAIGVSVISADSKALVEDGAVITATGGAVTVRSTSELDSTIKAIGLAVSSGGEQGNNAVGAAVGVNVAVGHNEARIGNAEVSAAGISVEALTPAGQSDDVVTWALAGAGSQGSGSGSNTSVAGAVAVNVGAFTTTADVVAGADLKSSAGVTIGARSDLGVQNIAGAGAAAVGGSGGAGVGAAVSVNVMTNTTTASIGAADVDAAQAIAVLADASVSSLKLDLPLLGDGDDPKVAGIALGGAASQSGPAVAGSFVVGVYTDNTTASIAPNAQVNQRALYTAATAQDVSVRALDDMEVFDLAGALAASLDSAGVGAAIDVQVLTQNVTASIGNSADVDAGGSVVVESFATQEQLSIAANIGFSNSSVAVGGAVSVIVDTNHIHAYIGDGAVVDANGSVVVQAAGDTDLTAIAGNASVSLSSTAVGVSNTTFVHTDEVKAWVGANAQITAKGNDGTHAVQSGERNGSGQRTTEAARGLAVTATSFEDVMTIAAGFSGGSSVGVGGSVTVNVLTETTEAYLGAGAQVNSVLTSANAEQDVLLRASDASDVFSIAGGGSYGGTGGIGAGIDIGVITKNTSAFVTDTATVYALDDMTIDAASDEKVFSVAANIGAGGFAVALSAGIYVVTTDTLAYIGDSLAGHASVQTGGDLSIKADDSADFNLVAGSAAIGVSSAGVGVSNSTLVHNDTVKAYVGAGSHVRSNGSVGLTVEATSSEDLLAVVAAGAGGSTAGVGGSVPVQVMNETTRAYIADGAQINVDAAVAGLPAASGTQGVHVRAYDSTDILSVGGTVGAGGTAGVAAGVEVLALNKNTTAFIGGATVNAEGDVKVEAQSSEEAGSIAMTLGVGGTAGVSLAAGIMVMNVTTNAFIGDDIPTDSSSLSSGVALVHAKGNVIIDADASTSVDNIGGSLGIGGTAGVGAAAAVTVLNKTTEAYVGRNADVTGDGDAASTASLGKFGAALYATDTGESEFSGLDGDGGYSGKIEVAPPDTAGTSDLSPESSSDNVGGDQVTKDRSIEVSTDSVRGVAVTATNRDSVESFGIAGGGGTVGVGVSGVVSVNSATTSAFIATGAKVNDDQSGANAGQDVLVAAADDYQHMTVVAGVAGGYVGA